MDLMPPIRNLILLTMAAVLSIAISQSLRASEPDLPPIDADNPVERSSQSQSTEIRLYDNPSIKSLALQKPVPYSIDINPKTPAALLYDIKAYQDLNFHAFLYGNIVRPQIDCDLRQYYDCFEYPFFVGRYQGTFVPFFVLGTCHDLPEEILPGRVRYIIWNLYKNKNTVVFSELGQRRSVKDSVARFWGDYILSVSNTTFSMNEVNIRETNVSKRLVEEKSKKLLLSSRPTCGFNDKKNWLSFGPCEVIENIKKYLSRVAEYAQKKSLINQLGKISPFALFMATDEVYDDLEGIENMPDGMDDYISDASKGCILALDSKNIRGVGLGEKISKSYREYSNESSFLYVTNRIEDNLRKSLSILERYIDNRDPNNKSYVPFRDIKLISEGINLMLGCLKLGGVSIASEGGAIGPKIFYSLNDTETITRNKHWSVVLAPHLRAAIKGEYPVFTFAGAAHFGERENTANDFLGKKIPGFQLVQVTPDMLEEMLELIYPFK